MSKESECISVIIPVYKGIQYLDKQIKQIEAAAKHSWLPVEIIFVNDDPGTILPEKQNVDNVKIQVLQTTINRGIHGARVRGLQHAKGTYILFLDQDDEILETYFTSQLKYISQGDASVCNVIHENKGMYTQYNSRASERANQRMIDGNNIVSPGQVLLRKSAIPPIWEKDIMVCSGVDDWLLWIYLQKEGKKLNYNPDFLYVHTENDDNTSANYFHMTRSAGEMYALIERNGMLSEEELKSLRQAVWNLVLHRMNILNRYCRQANAVEFWLKSEGKDAGISVTLKEKGIQEVALYGYGYVGRLLKDYLEKHEIRVLYIIDQKAKSLHCGVAAYTIDEKLPKTDAIIVTLVKNEEPVMEQLREKTNAEILSFKELI